MTPWPIAAVRPLALLLLLLPAGARAQQQRAALTPPQTLSQAAPAPIIAGPVLPLYHALRNVGLDPQRVYKIREAAIDREDIHLWLTDGTIAFTETVGGHITGAYF